MTALKHMETLFGIAAIAALLVAALPRHEARAAARARPAAPAQLHAAPTTAAEVVIKGKRLSARERRRAALASLMALASG
ncbi:hypothetical protein [Massilia sp. PWRC2]|uniref:hypothetical protein n=1 Tax=Massilia sp. PWRC2 TaxID=2804626 RepID=UPI003CE7FCDC